MKGKKRTPKPVTGQVREYQRRDIEFLFYDPESHRYDPDKLETLQESLRLTGFAPPLEGRPDPDNPKKVQV
jgi:hypothetical protein